MTHGRAACRISGAILAGGRARRLGGIAKGTIEVERGVSIVQRLIGEFSRAGIEEVVMATNDPGPYLRYGRQIVTDIRPGMGPLGGVEAALGYLAGRCDAVLFLPCDLPRIGSNEISVLCAAFAAGPARVVFAESGVFFAHALCSVVHIAVLPEVSAALDQGERRVRDLWRRLGAQGVRFDDESLFLNINEPEDLSRWQASHKEP